MKQSLTLGYILISLYSLDKIFSIYKKIENSFKNYKNYIFRQWFINIRMQLNLLAKTNFILQKREPW